MINKIDNEIHNRRLDKNDVYQIRTMSSLGNVSSELSGEAQDEVIIKNCIIINRKSRSDLWESSNDLRNNMKAAGINVEQLVVNSMSHTPDVLQKMKDENVVICDSEAWRIIEEESENDLDIAVAHYRALKRVIDGKWESCLIMEDNIDCLRRDFNNLNMKKWCDIRIHTPDFSDINKTALSYSVTNNGAKRMLQEMFPLDKGFIYGLRNKLRKYDFAFQNGCSDPFFQIKASKSNVSKLETFKTKYGFVTLYKNEIFIGQSFKNGKYWDLETLLKLQEYIDPNKNILEIGGHCGTSSLVYASFLNKGRLEVYEPQSNMYKILLKNIKDNNLEDKISAYNLGVFCFNGEGKMNDIDLDGGGGNVQKRYDSENELSCNFGGIGLGKKGENVTLTTIDNMGLDNVGFIHCDAQGSENFIFSKGLRLINEYRPVIFYENNQEYGKRFYNNICKSYPEYKEESVFDIKKYCIETLKYSTYIDKFNGGIDTLLIP